MNKKGFIAQATFMIIAVIVFALAMLFVLGTEQAYDNVENALVAFGCEEYHALIHPDKPVCVIDGQSILVSYVNGKIYAEGKER